MFSLAKHIYALERTMRTIPHLPTAFEYYSAIHMTQLYQKPFYVYQDIPAQTKQQWGFPLQDMGVDLADERFDHIAQVKYYRSDSEITYGRLSTFLATPLLVGRKHLTLSLLRPQESILHAHIQKIVMRGDITDHTLCAKAFLHAMK